MDERLHRAAYLGLQSLRGRPVGSFIRRLQHWERLDRASFERLTRERLRVALLRASRTVPFYSSRGWIRGEPTEIGSWPILERLMVQAHGQELLARRPRVGMYYRHSSSSSGSPLDVALNPHAAAWSWASEFRAMMWHGIQPGARTLMMWGGRHPLLDWIKNYRIFDVRHLSEGQLEAAAQYLLTRKVDVCGGLPSAIALLGRYVRSHYPQAPRRLVSFARVGGEQVYPFQREEIHAHLGAKLIEFYGCTEVGAIAAECPAGFLHVFAEHVHVEIVRDCEPVAPGELGDIVATSLTNHAMPLVRCRIGDRARLSPEPCSCGRPQPVLLDLMGRAADLFVAADGRKIHGAVLGQALKPFLEGVSPAAVQQVLFEQSDPLHWTILVESPQGFDERLVSRLAEIVHTSFGPECNVNVRRVDAIPREPSGKYRYYRPRLRIGNQGVAHQGAPSQEASTVH